MAAIITGIVWLAIAAYLTVAGIWLIMLGGNWYYALAALGFAATGLLLLARRAAALPVFAALLIVSLGWAVHEVGYDWWRLAPRGDVVVLLGLWLLTPWVTRSLDRHGGRATAVWRGAALPLAGATLLAGAVGLYAALGWPPNDIRGTLPEATVVDVPLDRAGVPAGYWHAYGRTGLGDRFSPLTQITTTNVAALEEAWVYHTGDFRRPGDPNETTYEVTPREVDGTLYLCTPHNFAIALDAATGEERWPFDPEVPPEANRQHLTCRGVGYHGEGERPTAAACAARIFMPTADARLIALDAVTGAVCSRFGEGGSVDLAAHMAHMQPGDPAETAPIPPGETYTPNSPNSWSVMSVDEELGLLCAPLGNAPPDQRGGNRSAETERFTASVIALDLVTGELRWVLQTVHHDL